MKVVIRTDASYRIGTGHVMRCLTLAKALVEMGAEVSFICRDIKGNIIDRIQQEGFQTFRLLTNGNVNIETGHVVVDSNNNRFLETHHSAPSKKITTNDLAHSAWLGVSQYQDALDCESILGKHNPDWLIVDHYSIDETWHKQLKRYYRKLMVIDDLGDRNHDCDLLLDQNYGSSTEKYKNRVPKYCTILAGPLYALLRPEFAQWREVSLKRREDSQEVETILVTMGGVDPDNYTGQVLHQLEKVQLSTLNEITVVMGATAPHLETIQQQAQAMPIKTSVKTNVSNMAELMTNADLAVGAAGATTWERCCLGLPTVQVVIAENQRQIAHALAKDHAVLLMEEIKQLPGLVIDAASELNALSESSTKVCDGYGVSRVSKYLIESK